MALTDISGAWDEVTPTIELRDTERVRDGLGALVILIDVEEVWAVLAGKGVRGNSKVPVGIDID